MAKSEMRKAIENLSKSQIVRQMAREIPDGIDFESFDFMHRSLLTYGQRGGDVGSHSLFIGTVAGAVKLLRDGKVCEYCPECAATPGVACARHAGADKPKPALPAPMNLHVAATFKRGLDDLVVCMVDVLTDSGQKVTGTAWQKTADEALSYAVGYALDKVKVG